MSHRVLTVKQPWADLIMDGVKDVENRTWPVPSTLPQWVLCHVEDCGRWPPDSAHALGAQADQLDGPFPFRLWIHAANQVARPCSDAVLDAWLVECHREGVYEQYTRGALLGSVEVTGCHHARDCFEHVRGDVWAHDRYCSPWADPDVYHWTLTDPQPLDDPIPMRGHQRLWNLAWHLDPQEIAHA